MAPQARRQASIAVDVATALDGGGSETWNELKQTTRQSCETRAGRKSGKQNNERKDNRPMANGMSNQYADDVVVRVSEYELPPEGSHQAVCVDVVDLGEVVGQYGPQHKVALVFQITPDPDTGVDVARTDGERFEVVRRFSANLSERGYLRPFLEAWRGRKFTSEELKGFHLSKLVGVNALIQVIHESKGERTYANINTAQPWLLKFGPKIDPQNYTRRVKRQEPQERPTREQAQAATAAQAPNHRTPVQSHRDEFGGDPWEGESL